MCCGRKKQRTTSVANDDGRRADIIALRRCATVMHHQRHCSNNNDYSRAQNQHMIMKMQTPCRSCTQLHSTAHTEIDQLIDQLEDKKTIMATLVPHVDRLMRRRSRTAFDLYDHTSVDPHTQQRRTRLQPPLVKNSSLMFGLGGHAPQTTAVPIMDRLRSALGTSGVHELVTVFRTPVWMGALRIRYHPWLSRARVSRLTAC
jgi:hypothetical protein